MVTYYPTANGQNERYKDTPMARVTASGPGSEIFTIYDPDFVPPVEFATFLGGQTPATGTYSLYTVTREDVGFPDRIAYLCYGANQEIHWWVIAMVNGILDPETDLFPGQRLIVPSYALLQQFLSRAPSAAEIQSSQLFNPTVQIFL
jgi:hypothetical protein